MTYLLENREVGPLFAKQSILGSIQSVATGNSFGSDGSKSLAGLRLV